MQSDWLSSILGQLTGQPHGGQQRRSRQAWQTALILAAIAVAAWILSLQLAGPPPAAQPTSVPESSQQLFASATDAPLATPQAAATPVPLTSFESTSADLDYGGLLFKLVIVLALAYGALYALKRLGLAGSLPGGRVGSNLRVDSSLTLAANRSLHVVRAPNGRAYLVGATPTQVNLVADLGELPEEPAAAVAPPSFAAALQSMFSRDLAGPAEVPSAAVDGAH